MTPTKTNHKIARAKADTKGSATPSSVGAPTHQMILRDKKLLWERRHIAEVAVHLFEVKGFAETTVEEISKASGYSVGTFYRLFADKGDVVFYDFSERLEYLKASFASPDHGNAWNTIRGVFIEFAHLWETEEGKLSIRRARLYYHEPVLIARYLAKTLEWEDEMAKLVSAEYKGDPKQDLLCRVVAGAASTAFRAAWHIKFLNEDLALTDCVRNAFDKLEELGLFFQTSSETNKKRPPTKSRKPSHPHS
jgi:AcrR family transcriptional regulator